LGKAYTYLSNVVRGGEESDRGDRGNGYAGRGSG